MLNDEIKEKNIKLKKLVSTCLTSNPGHDIKITHGNQIRKIIKPSFHPAQYWKMRLEKKIKKRKKLKSSWTNMLNL